MSSNNQVAIKVENLGKCYHIYNQPQDRLKQAIIPRLQSLIGKPPKKYFREFWALQDISFEVKKGETIGIIGRNGSGKSTLLQLICGTLTPTSGTVKTTGRIAALLELGSGFNMEFTGRENVYLNGAVLGLSKEEIDTRFADIAAFADIGDFLEQPVKMYSSGMVVRLAFSVQAMIAPDILIVDEALAVGDEKFQRKCFARLEELKSRGTAILFVSHSGPQIVDLCDGALLLEHGARLMYSQPFKVVRAYQKLIYAPPDQYSILMHEYRTADQLGDGKDSFEPTHLEVGFGDKRSTDQSGDTITNIGYVQSDNGVGGNQTTDKSVSESINNGLMELEIGSSNDGKEDYFDAGLVPETMVVYPLQGAEILSFQILSVDGHPVNILSSGKNYRFVVSGQFLSDSHNVYFGIHIRSISGTVITGQQYPEEGNFIELVRAGQSFRITYDFKMILLPGAYFVGGGVWSSNEPNCLHRILDALMFRIMPDQKMKSFGYVDASLTGPHLEIV